MRKLGCLPIAVGAWLVVTYVPAIIMTLCGVHPDSYGVAPICVVVVGPIAAFIAGFTFVKHCDELEMMEKARALKEENRRMEVRRRTEEDRRQQEAIRTEVKQLTEELHDAPQRLRQSLPQVNECLNDAHRFFSERAYSRFWTAVEQALDRIRTIKSNIDYYRRKVDRYEVIAKTVVSDPEKIELDFKEFAFIDNITESLSQLVAKAHREYEFVMVYETRQARSAELERLEEERRQREEDDGD